MNSVSIAALCDTLIHLHTMAARELLQRNAATFFEYKRIRYRPIFWLESKFYNAVQAEVRDLILARNLRIRRQMSGLLINIQREHQRVELPFARVPEPVLDFFQIEKYTKFRTLSLIQQKPSRQLPSTE